MASNRLGQELAAALRDRIADLRAAETKKDLVVGNPTIRGPRGELLMIELVKGAFMTWTANHPSPRLNEDGSIDWSRVSRIRLLRIGGASRVG